ncbi:pyrimidine dimer DNA glycosylase/endonuclease V [Trueperella pyogenes]|uniref:DNA lyase n=1 Tax=Trueperella pyogenes TaxID=1661 RepID=A0A3S9QLT8_9ACTO|nr:pyrimidine dimer DNA glycosylase/endonuclease V [Trueperella pyogenes]AZR06918.1 DNA lyase [Trueperella pyogenes]
MRMWSLHPSYLDPAGLVALWRETLLAQKVLQGLTKGYRNHPQLERFALQSDPLASIGSYLSGVLAEAAIRGYNFDATKIVSPADAAASPYAQRIEVSDGQLAYELRWLRTKLERRSPATLQSGVWEGVDLGRVLPHPLFVEVPGPIASWEKVDPAPASL